MSELEHALRATLADPPADVPNDVHDPLWDIEVRIERRRRVRRRGVLAAMACAAVAAVVVPISVYGTPSGTTAASNATGQASSESAAAGGAVPESTAVPPAVRTAAEKAAHGPDTRADPIVRWVQTTSDRLWTFGSYANTKPPNHAIYVIQLHGRFPCASCTSPIGGMVSVRTVTIPVSDRHPLSTSAGPYVLSDETYDLAKLGVVRTFSLR